MTLKAHSIRGAAGLFSVGLCTVALAFSATGAYADTGSTTSTSTPGKAGGKADLATLQQKGEAAIDQRLTSIQKMQAELASTKAKNVTPAHAATLQSLLATDSSSLTALRTKIAADTDKATVVTDDKSIVTDYRVYMMVGPQVHGVIVSDDLTAVFAKESTLATQKGNQAALTAIQQGQTSLNGQADVLLGLQPSDFPNSQASAKGAITALKEAAADAKTARDDLKATGGKAAKTTAPTADATV